MYVKEFMTAVTAGRYYYLKLSSRDSKNIQRRDSGTIFGINSQNSSGSVSNVINHSDVLSFCVKKG